MKADFPAWTLSLHGASGVWIAVGCRPWMGEWGADSPWRFSLRVWKEAEGAGICRSPACQDHRGAWAGGQGWGEGLSGQEWQLGQTTTSHEDTRSFTVPPQAASCAHGPCPSQKPALSEAFCAHTMEHKPELNRSFEGIVLGAPGQACHPM